MSVCDCSWVTVVADYTHLTVGLAVALGELGECLGLFLGDCCC